MALDKTTYRTDEDIRFTFTVTNTGSTTAKGLWVSQHIIEPTDLFVPYDPGWGPLTSGKPGVDLEPGKSFVFHGTGKVREVDQATTVLRGVVFDATHFGVGEFSADAKVVPAPGHAEGVVYGDKNGNGKRDPGEELAGAKLTLRYVNGGGTHTATSGPDGTIVFDVPGAEYYVGGEVVDGWLIPLRVVRIGADTHLDVRGAPPLNGALKASMAFTQSSYQAGEPAHVTVTLSNSGPIPLRGVVAECNRVGNDYILKGTGPGWGDLVWSRGVTLAAGETRTFDVTETVPKAAFNRGFVAAYCDFGYYEVDIDNHAQARAEAAVPGAKGNVVGDVTHGTGQGLAEVKIVLVSDRHCPVTGEATTDAKGHFEFHDVVPGPAYRLYLLPPKGWKVKYENPTSIDVWGGQDSRVGIDVVEGDAPLPTVPTNPADCTATTPTSTTAAAGGSGGGQSGGSGLASTGVDALGLGALALIALALGGGRVLGARRRRRSA
ncbi:hypothetical protein AB0J40_35360 [Amycolatopsis sp. NPDC049691]|uniref:hypothetical protein n=1 Tax=Amycolatopsis sp. NPDC049691 TaxID=3155155 RepID=UPI003438ABCA